MASIIRVCKMCKEKYTRTEPAQTICSVKCALAFVEKNNRKEYIKKTRKLRRDYYATDRVHLTKKAQKVFNRFIRLRDDSNVCISCGRKEDWQMHAGHYRDRGSYPALRFEPLNCHMQCSRCNRFKSGNLSNYRINLIEKIGLKKVEWLEGEHPCRPLTIAELKEIYNKYNKFIKDK